MTDQNKVSFHSSDQVLNVLYETGLTERSMYTIQTLIMEKLKREAVKGVVLNFSNVHVIDSYVAEEIEKTYKMIQVMGMKPVAVGFQPGVVVSLINLGIFLQGIQIALNLEDGIALIEKHYSQEKHIDSDEDEEFLDESSDELESLEVVDEEF